MLFFMRLLLVEARYWCVFVVSAIKFSAFVTRQNTSNFTTPYKITFTYRGRKYLLCTTKNLLYSIHIMRSLSQFFIIFLRLFVDERQ